MSKVFFSWQADRPGKTGRHLIHDALEDAVKAILAEAVIEDADRDEIHVDSDTRGVAGTPPIFDTILKKIDAAAAFVADVTFVGERADGRRMPNPNVMIEYGWALRAITWQRLIGVMNVFYGDPAKFDLPFDLGHLRRPITYSCADDADAATIKAERKKLATIFKSAIELILAQDIPAPIPRKEYAPMEPAVGNAWFRSDGDPIGILHDGSPIQKESSPVRLARGPVMWLRVMPRFEPKNSILNTALRSALIAGGDIVLPLNMRDQGGTPYGIRGADGYGFGINVSAGETLSVVYAFDRGEVWSIDAAMLKYWKGKIFFDTNHYATALTDFSAFLKRVGVEGPYRWSAGLEGVQGRVLHPVGRSFVFPPAESVANSVVGQGDFSGDPNEALASLEPFFAAVYDLGHLTRS